MTEKQKEYYKNQMEAKSLAYAEEQLQDVKAIMSEEDYKEVLTDLQNAFCMGANTAVEVAKEVAEIKE